MDQAKCGVQITLKKHLPDWTKNVKINGKSMKTHLDTGCTKSLVHPKCVKKKDYLGYQIPYQKGIKQMCLFSRCQHDPRVVGEEVEDSRGRI